MFHLFVLHNISSVSVLFLLTNYLIENQQFARNISIVWANTKVISNNGFCLIHKGQIENTKSKVSKLSK